MITTLLDALQALGQSAATLFWQPLLAWTLVAVPLYLGLRAWRTAPALLHYRAHLALLMALPLSLLLAPFMPGLPAAPFFASGPAPEMVAFETTTLAATDLSIGAFEPPQMIVAPHVPAPAWTAVHMMGLLTVLALGAALFLLVRQAVLAFQLYRYRTSLPEMDDPRAVEGVVMLALEVGVKDPVKLLQAPPKTTPMTFGLRRPVIVLPADLPDDSQALWMTLVHELVHVRRRDYAVGWVVRVVGCLFALHPGVWLLQRRIEQYREVSCDAEVLGERRVPRWPYVELLLRFSPLADPAGPIPLRMVELDSTLKQRLQAMKDAVTGSDRLRRWITPATLCALLLPALVAACTVSFNKSEANTDVDADEAMFVSTTSDEAAPTEEPAGQPGEQPSQDALFEITVARQAQSDVNQALVQLKERMEALSRSNPDESERARAAREVERAQVLAKLDALREESNALAREREEAAAQQAALAEEMARRLNQQQRMHEALQARMNVDAHLRTASDTAELNREVERLGIQIDYLQKEIKAVSEEMQTASDRGPLQLLRQRFNLLESLYMQRLETYETLKMEQYTAERMAVSGESPTPRAGSEAQNDPQPAGQPAAQTPRAAGANAGQMIPVTVIARGPGNIGLTGEIFIDGKGTGYYTPSPVFVPVGTRKIEVKVSGYEQVGGAREYTFERLLEEPFVVRFEPQKD